MRFNTKVENASYLKNYEFFWGNWYVHLFSHIEVTVQNKDSKSSHIESAHKNIFVSIVRPFQARMKGYLSRNFCWNMSITNYYEFLLKINLLSCHDFIYTQKSFQLLNCKWCSPEFFMKIRLQNVSIHPIIIPPIPDMASVGSDCVAIINHHSMILSYPIMPFYGIPFCKSFKYWS